jgi:DNA mismatch repair protein MutL
MSRIKRLEPQVAERIAAGEVIERPSSVVKELVENALDAGATEIAVILEDGGKALIEILDNGYGMDVNDLKLCTERHATSKLRSVEDLDRISTLGFRGEALPSVLAVSDLTITTRAQGADTTNEFQNGEIEKVTFGHFLGSPHGTRMIVRALFSEIPARLKFLKSARAEVANIRDWMERLALSHPKVGFRLASGDRTVLRLKPDTERNRVHAVLSDGNDYPIVMAKDNGVTAYWLQGLSAPTTKKMIQTLNGRVLKDRLIQQAMLRPFKQILLPGQFPALAVYLDLPPDELDLNVHPTKTEVRFLDSRGVFRRVEKLLDEMIGTAGAPGFAASSQGFPATGTPQPYGGPSSQGYSASSFGSNEARGATTLEQSMSSGSSSSRPVFAPLMKPSQQGSLELSAAKTSQSPLLNSRFSGSLFRTYLVFEEGDEVQLVDQHAAHERIRFERLKSQAMRSGEVERQELLLPEAIKVTEEQRIDVESRLELLSKMGFEAEAFGQDTIVFRAIPSVWGDQSLNLRLKNLLDRLIESEATLFDETLFEKLASEACHSAVRAGDDLHESEARALVDELFDMEHPWNCPHGRPTLVKVPRHRFETWFQRKL